MKHTLNDALTSIKEARNNLNESKNKLDKVVRKGTIARETFMEIVNKEVNIVWKAGKEKNIKKIEWSKTKKEIDPEIEVYKGILVGDKKLEEFERNNVTKNESDDKANICVYAGIELNEKEEKILSLPLQHTTFPKLDVEAFDTELQKCVVKASWQKMYDMRKAEDDKVMEEMNEIEESNEELGKVYNSINKELNFKNLKATDIKGNRRIIMPEPDDDPDEIRRNNVKNELKNVFLQYRKESCDKFGNQLDNNLDNEELKTIKNLRNKMDKDNLICYETDKTGKRVLDTVENYAKKMMKHIENDEIILEKKVRKIENKLNEHVDDWMDMTNAGEHTKQNGRIKSNMKSKEGQLPALKGSSKDHKVAEDKTVGPELRPIMGSFVGPNLGLANIGGIVIRRISEEADVGYVCKSTEEMQVKFEKYNNERIENGLGDKKIVIGSMDAVKLYPSLKPTELGESAKNMIIDSKIKLEGITYDAASMYLAKFMDKDDIIKENMEDILYTKKVEKDADQKWNPPKRKPSEPAKKKNDG